MARGRTQATGAPGGPAVWNPGSKAGVGTALGEASPVWFTLGRGSVEETYFPRADNPRARDLAFVVADGAKYFSWEKADTDSEAATLEEGVPAYRLVNRCRQGRYRVEKDVFSHPDHPAVVQRVRFRPARGSDLQLYAILNPHIAERADAWVGDFKGTPMLFAAGNGAAVALACSVPWLKRSVGFVGKSDGWQDLSKHRRMTWEYERADGGNVVLTGQIDYPAGGDFLLVLGFGLNPEAAGLHAHAATLDGFDAPLARSADKWKEWQQSLLPLGDAGGRAAVVYRASTAVMRTHEAKLPPGASVASLAIPFGQARTGDDTGGYHLVWPRDLVETVGGLLAAGSPDHVTATLQFLEATQEADGHWSQNMWLSSKPHWDGTQMDETALPVLLLEIARREGAVTKAAAANFWPMVRRAAGYLVRNGPYTPVDRWEHDGGYSPFTLGAEIGALLVAADLATETGDPVLARYLRETADIWNASIERWTYVTGTDLARRVGVDGKDCRGRARPLFAGERGHYELAAGRPGEAGRMLRLMEDMATDTGLIPEQVWDSDDIPAKGLFRGRPTTSACPLVWAHAEYVKLRRSLHDGAVFDLPRQTVRRYGKKH